MLPPDYLRTAISPKYLASKLAHPTVDDKIDVFEDQMFGFLFDHAISLLSPNYPGHAHAGVAALMISGAYFETIASFIQGKSSEGHSRQFFGIGLQAVFPNFSEILQTSEKIDEFSSLLYRELRCGLFHESGPRSKIILQYEQPSSIGVLTEDGTGKVTTLLICPTRFVHQVVGHFQHYLKQLRDSSPSNTMQKAFERAWDIRMKGAFPAVPPSGQLPKGFNFETIVPRKRKTTK